MSVTFDSPDFQSYTNWRGEPALLGAQSCTNVSSYLQVFRVDNWESLFFQITNQSGPLEVIVYFETPPPTSVVSNQYIYQLPIANTLHVILPILGNQCIVNILGINVGTTTFTIIAQPTNFAATKAIYPVTDNTVRQQGISVAASSTTFINIPVIMEGIAYLTYQYGDAAGKLQITVQEMNPNGTPLQTIFFIAPNAATTYEELVFNTGAYAVQITVQNTDAAAPHTYSLRCQVLSQ